MYKDEAAAAAAASAFSRSPTRSAINCCVFLSDGVLGVFGVSADAVVGRLAGAAGVDGGDESASPPMAI